MRKKWNVNGSKCSGKWQHVPHIHFNDRHILPAGHCPCFYTVADRNDMFILPGLQSEGPQIKNIFVPAAKRTCFLSVQSGDLLTQYSIPLAACPCTFHPAWTPASCTAHPVCYEGGIKAARKDQILPCSRPSYQVGLVDCCQTRLHVAPTATESRSHLPER